MNNNFGGFMITGQFREKDLFNATFSVVAGIWLLFLATAYRTRAGNTNFNIFSFQFMVFLIFGIGQAASEFKLRQEIYRDINIVPSAISFLGLICIYTAFYNIVLFPLSGIGMIEWTLVCLTIFANALSKFMNKKILNIGQSPMAIWNFGVLLFFIKIIWFFFFEENIYQETIQGNFLLRLLIGVVGAGAILLLLTQLKTKIFGKPQNKNDNFIVRFIKNSLSFFGGLVKSGLSILKGPQVIIAGLIGSIVALVSVNKILLKIEATLSPYIEKLLTSGENTIPLTYFYITYQLISFISISIYLILADVYLKNEAKKIAMDNYHNFKNTHPNIPNEALLEMQNDIETQPLLVASRKNAYNLGLIKSYKLIEEKE